ncbi:MAG: hypothetical protein JWQ30_1606 [Sediminibacterium sp.]|nr:hypothetical protein [Sediminibacterium sp.]
MGVRWPISKMERPVPLKSKIARDASSSTGCGRMDGPELKLYTLIWLLEAAK